VPVDGGTAVNRTADNPGADAQPSYSPDGRLFGWLSQRRAGFESDQWVFKVRDAAAPAGRPTPWSAVLDRPVLSYSWCAPDSPTGRVLWSVDDSGRVAIVPVHVSGADAGAGPVPGLDAKPPRLVSEGANSAAQAVGTSRSVVFLHGDAAHPNELYRVDGESARPVALTHHNDPLTAELDLPGAESFTFEGAGGDRVQGWLVRPPGFDASKKYPVVFLIHGGPQGAWHDEWHARWNYQMFAAPGYAVVAINPRGSTGFGQKFTDQISQDWTGKVYEDLMRGLDHALKAYPFLDRDRVAAAGGSYGGFMVNWIAGHSDRFKCLVSHAGVFDLTSKYGTTEELWFPEWEFGGTPWERPEHYRERSPSAFVRSFKTPTLVIHGALDFRVPDAQGLGMFTALQRRGVPSRYVFFPDEGHWILKPANRVVWWREVHDWLAKYLKTTAR
jgi:dipeptidyl aminopeptidase/acylaminoacyl peptidase